MHSYVISGLAVASEIELAGMMAAPPDRPADVTIRRGTVPERLDAPKAEGPTWSLAREEMVLRVPDIARFRLSGGREIVYESEGGSDNDVAAFIAGMAFGVLLQLRGEIILQASAVRVEGKAVLFCGLSGQGKSTLAAALTQRGYPMLTDDICVLRTDDEGRATAYPDGRMLRLWSRSLKRLEWEDRRGAPVRDCLQKYLAAPPAVVATALPAGALYLIRHTRPPNASGITRPNVVDAALALRRASYRPMLIGKLDQRPLYFRAAALLNHVGVYQLTFPFEFGALPQTLDRLEDHWRETGVSEEAA